MSSWDIAILSFGGFVAVMTLTRLMLRTHDRLLEEKKREDKKRAATDGIPAPNSMSTPPQQGAAAAKSK